MPHTNDQDAFTRINTVLRFPKSLLRQTTHSGRVDLDSATTAQQEINAVLFECFLSSRRTHPWDLMRGRALPDLMWYFHWFYTLPDKLIIYTNTADRMASYLLPYMKTFSDNSFEISGIPGLRRTRCTADAVHLEHTPTGACVELRDSTGFEDVRSLRWSLKRELDFRHRKESEQGRVAVHLESASTPQEQAAFRALLRPADAALWSALLVRLRLWTETYEHNTVLTRSKRSNAGARVSWSTGITANEMGRLLTEGALRIADARFIPGEQPFDVGVLSLRGAAIELDGPEPAPA